VKCQSTITRPSSTSNFGKWFGSRPFSSWRGGRVYVGADLRCMGIDVRARMRACACAYACVCVRVCVHVSVSMNTTKEPKGWPQAAIHRRGYTHFLAVWHNDGLFARLRTSRDIPREIAFRKELVHRSQPPTTDHNAIVRAVSYSLSDRRVHRVTT